MPPYAHTPNGNGQWHELKDHLAGVARRAKEFGDSFGAGDWAERAGWLHDVGKATPGFQSYLEACHRERERRHKGPPHSIFGALVAVRQRLDLLSLIIAGHHGGLPSLNIFRAETLHRAEKNPAFKELESHLKALNLPAFPLGTNNLPKSQTGAEMFIRMLFSTLVDADFLDTEAHMRAADSDKRTVGLSLQACWHALKEAQEELSGHVKTPLNLARHEIYLACLKAAEEPQGFFRLTVPTGGGKTRSGMAFALRHALTHGMDRVIVAIPYTSIVDQNVAVYRGIFGDEAVLEHHSNADWRSQEDPEDEPEWALRQRLASENWDAPIIVTTTVQLFESLFSNRVSACRKLHNIAKSVIILDEAQMLPESLLAPILDALKELVGRYNATVVFSSATQPAFQALEEAIGNAREIIPNPDLYFRALRRVRYERPPAPWTWEDLAAQLRQHPSVMVVLNRKKDALAAMDALNDPEAYHLSTSLYPAHRRKVLCEIRNKLNRQEPCRLVATQVVEAGVDLDFPVVFRAVGPLDRIVQAAGRCNREGRLGAEGRVIVFNPADGGVPRGAYAAGLGNALSLLADPGADLNDPVLYETYFMRLYQGVNTDAKNIQERRKAFDYPEVAERFRMIDSPTASVLVRRAIEEDEKAQIELWLDRWLKGWVSPRIALRKLQPFIVNLYQKDLDRAVRDHLAKPLASGLYEWLGRYDARRGLAWDAADPADLIF